jgi:tetratricopeptide (TPR) repeat protein
MNDKPPHSQLEDPPSDNHEKVITPLKVTVKEQTPAGAADIRKNSQRFILVGVSLVVLLAGGAGLLIYLSKRPVSPTSVSTDRVSTEQLPEALPQTSTVSEGQSRDEAVSRGTGQEKQEAEQKLADFLLVKNEMDARGVAEWGGALYEKVGELSDAADAFLINGQFRAASESYAEALRLLKGLRARSGDALSRLLDEGARALEEGEGSRAEQLFRTALMIDPENTFAVHNLERAKTVEEVNRLLTSGEQHEQNGNLSFAHADYQEALDLDAESKKARAALERITTMIAEEQFQQLMSSGFSALQGKDLARARTLFLKAKSFKPDSPEVKDALIQVDAAARLGRIESLRKKARAAEDSERWQQAVDLYHAVLEIDATIQFAIQGRERSERRRQIEKRINYYLEKPEVLSSDTYLAKALNLREEAKLVEPKGPRYSEQLKKLDELVVKAQTPIRVTIKSDRLTEVIVYKVGKLGRFDEQELTLRPGTYTIVGSRNGFKDVRKKIQVQSGGEPLRIVVECDEKI